ncbi:MAG: hypothetical protein LLG20_17740 [Acidobacteriales bacterium]|nr:hypothetical protein [Terriglobales bacterium]
MNPNEVFTFLSASLAAGVSLGFAVSQYRTWTRARRWRRITARLIEGD